MNHLYKYLLAFSILSLLNACKNNSETSLEEEKIEPSEIIISKNQFTSSEFELGKVQKMPFSKMLLTTGSIHLPEKSKASVSTLLSGTIGPINLEEGQWVSKGQKLFTVTNPDLINLQEEYLITIGQLEYLKEEYDRLLVLSKENLSTKKDLLKSKSELNTIQAKYGSMHKKLNLYGINPDNVNVNNLVSSLSVNAPISGYISAIHTMQGMYIEPNYSAITIDNSSQIYLKLSVLEKDASLLEKGQKVIFTLQDDPNKKHNATIHLINTSINEQHMITVICKLEDETKQFIPGMFASASILLENYTVNALPESAVVKMNDIYYALSLRKKDSTNMIFSKRVIEAGEIQNGYVELIKPVTSNTDFLTKGTYFLVK